MRIGIITFWQTRDNYGQVLQGFALQYKLKELGHKPFLIRYTHSEVPFPFRRRVRHFIKNALLLRLNSLFLHKRVLPPISANDTKRDFDHFKRTYMEMSATIYRSWKELKKNPPLADCYLTGSDQVWSKSLKDNENRSFFLDFGSSHIKRISYAASFAMEEYPSDDCGKLRKLLEKFDAISIRERTGVKICKHLEIEAKWVVDPTLLFIRNDYSKLFGLKKESTNNIYIYCINILQPDEIRFHEIQELAKTYTSQIVVTPSSGYIPSAEIFEGVEYTYPTVQSWLQTIDGAKLVITTSFHGIMFCLLFHTPFVYVGLKGKYGRGNNRVIDLLKTMGLTHRILGDESKLIDVVLSRIDWDVVDKEIAMLRKYSIDFLESNLR